MNTLFTHRDKIDGKVGIGKVPYELLSILDDKSKEYINYVTDKSSTTYHTYYNDLTDKLKENFDKIQYNSFWNNICDNSDKCIKYIVPEMNELYYSNPKPNFEKHNLYGAAANLIPHRDCILYNFAGISFYRIIIGLTNSNNDTLTEFINFGIEHKINRGDFMIFDFDKTLHQVKKLGQQETPRILLKLHFIVCENCDYSHTYVKYITNFYKYYYYIARYTEQIGTDPKTFVGFFFGLMWEWPFYTTFIYTSGALFITISIAVNVIYNIKFEIKNIHKLFLYPLSIMFFMYLLLVYFYYIRYVLLGIK
jgi:hypothetical protein